VVVVVVVVVVRLYSLFVFVGLRKLSLSLSCVQSAGHLGHKISRSNGLCLHTGQHKQNRHNTDTHVSNGIRTLDSSVWEAKTVQASDRAVTMIGRLLCRFQQIQFRGFTIDYVCVCVCVCVCFVRGT
jgi:hypothetical protein